MARWLAPLPDGEAVCFDPALHGPGKPGIRKWRDAALAFLAEHGSHPAGDSLDIRRQAIAELLNLYDREED